ncbi:MAG: LysM peptidoglycan-binding domain-containing M23 family metallopeptidase [Anaerolineae bacterium]|nr:LysM peptidoglycan-binding domain-containing M23 family metallopeptidase [Anaerolineae bacterium]
MTNLQKALNFIITLTLLLLGATRAVMAAPLSGNNCQIDGHDLIYTVQPGDTLTLIAWQYNLTLADLILTNNLPNPNLIFPGQQLILPGVPPPSPSPSLPLPSDQFHVVQPGETLFGIANMYGVSIGALVLANDLPDPNLIQVGQTLQIPAGPPPTPEPLAAPFQSIELSEPVIIQGRTLVIKVTLAAEATLSGNFEGRPLFFSNDGHGHFWSIIAIHALTEPNIYPLTLAATLPDGAVVTTFQNVTVVEGPYSTENIELDDSHSELLDAELIRLEREKMVDLWRRVSPRPRWEGPFRYPVEVNSLRITSYFGTRRSYNNSPDISFHGGVDFGGGTGKPIYAAAAGTVVLAEELTLRGKAVLIDHGMGLFSGYWHQSQLAVTVGQEVQVGDLIGYMGDTGLVTGPHLHWEIRLQGIAVEPLQWVQEAIP